MTTFLALLLAVAAGAQTEMTPPQMPAGVLELHDRFISSTDPNQKLRLLEEIARTPAATTRDVQSLFDLFLRFDDSSVRDAAMRSLQLISFESPDLDDLFLHYLQQPEPEAKLFAIKGAARVRDRKALPLIEKLASSKFPFKNVDDAVLMGEKNDWWVRFAAVEALAQWRGEDAMPMLVKKSEEVPEVARIMGIWLWRQSLPYFVKWAGSNSRLDQDRARAGLSAPAPTPDLRATRVEMIARLRDSKAPKELRHQLALKIGLTSLPEETAGLLKEYETLKNPEDQLMYRVCLFATRDKQVAPLLIKTSREDENALNRAGALVELKDLVSVEEMRPLWEWTSANDSDAGNREMAARELRILAAQQPKPAPKAVDKPAPRKKARKG